MKVAFRADASVTIGTGHVMRCLTLAERLRSFGADCTFLTREHEGHLHPHIEARGFKSLLLAPGVAVNQSLTKSVDYRAWLGVEPLKDAMETLTCIGDEYFDWMVVDHYGLDAVWECAMRSRFRYLLAIDDLANRPHAVDLLLDQNLGKTPMAYNGLVPSTCICMTGPQFALLRPEFAAVREKSLARRKLSTVRRLLITMGGVDAENATGAILDALALFEKLFELHVTVVLGPSAPWRNQVIEQARTLPFPAEVLVSVKNMAELMCEADVAIGAAGSTSWERCCLGLPSVQLVLADNQRPIAEALSAAGAACLVEMNTLSTDLYRILDQIFNDNSLLYIMSEAAAKVTDGFGTERVARQLVRGF